MLPWMEETFALSLKGAVVMGMEIHIARRSDGFYRASCPALPGCVVYGRSWREARIRIAWAVRGYLSNINDILPEELYRRIRADQTCTAA